MNRKTLIGIIAALGILLAAETAYLVGAKSQKRNTFDSAGGFETRPYARSPQSKNSPWQVPSHAQNPFQQIDSQDSWDALDSWDPFQEMEEMHRTINRMFRNSLSRSFLGSGRGFGGAGALTFDPDIDISDTGSHYVIKADVPGLEKDKINIEVREGYLELSGERRLENEDKRGDSFYRIERSYGSFSRTIPLPADANAEEVKADYANGVITITIGKIKSAELKANPKGTKIPLH